MPDFVELCGINYFSKEEKVIIVKISRVRQIGGTAMDESNRDLNWIIEENKRLREENTILIKTVEQMNHIMNRLLNQFVIKEPEDM